MSEVVLNIGIIGAGKTGTPLIQNLLSFDFIKVVGIADVTTDAPGILLAQEKGIFTTTDFFDLAKLGQNVDIIIDVSGDSQVREKLRNYFQENNNSHTILMPELIAILMMSMAKGELVKSLHGYQKYN